MNNAAIIIAALCILVLMSLIFKRSRILDMIILIFLWSLCTFCSYSYDLENYRFVYESYPIIRDRYSIVFDFLFFGCAKVGLSFTAFQGIISAFSLILIYYTIKKYAYYSTFVFALFSIYPFSMFITQIRSSMAISISVFAICSYLFGEKHNKKIFFILIIVAAMIHWMSLLFLAVLLSDFNFIRRNSYKLIVFFIIICAVIININFQPLLLSLGISNRIAQYFNLRSGNTTGYFTTTVLLVSFQALVFIFTGYFIKKFKQIIPAGDKYIINNTIQIDDWNLSIIYYIESFMFILIPTYFIPTDSIRLLKASLPILYIALGNYGFCQKNMKSKSNANFVFFLVVIFLSLVYFFSSRRIEFETIKTLNSYSLL